MILGIGLFYLRNYKNEVKFVSKVEVGNVMKSRKKNLFNIFGVYIFKMVSHNKVSAIFINIILQETRASNLVKN